MLIKHQSFEVPHERKSGQWESCRTLKRPRHCLYLKCILIPGIIGFMLLCILSNVNFERNPKGEIQNAVIVTTNPDLLTEKNTLSREDLDEMGLKQQFPVEYESGNGIFKNTNLNQPRTSDKKPQTEVPNELKEKSTKPVKTESEVNNDLQSLKELPTKVANIVKWMQTSKSSFDSRKQIQMNKFAHKEDRMASEIETVSDIGGIVGNSLRFAKQLNQGRNFPFSVQLTGNRKSIQEDGKQYLQLQGESGSDTGRLAKYLQTSDFTNPVVNKKGMLKPSIGGTPKELSIPSYEHKDAKDNIDLQLKNHVQTDDNIDLAVGNTIKWPTNRRHNNIEHQYLAMPANEKIPGFDEASASEDKHLAYHLQNTEDTNLSVGNAMELPNQMPIEELHEEKDASNYQYINEAPSEGEHLDAHLQITEDNDPSVENTKALPTNMRPTVKAHQMNINMDILQTGGTVLKEGSLHNVEATTEVKPSTNKLDAYKHIYSTVGNSKQFLHTTDLNTGFPIHERREGNSEAQRGEGVKSAEDVTLANQLRTAHIVGNSQQLPTYKVTLALRTDVTTQITSTTPGENEFQAKDQQTGGEGTTPGSYHIMALTSTSDHNDNRWTFNLNTGFTRTSAKDHTDDNGPGTAQIKSETIRIYRSRENKFQAEEDKVLKYSHGRQVRRHDIIDHHVKSVLNMNIINPNNRTGKLPEQVTENIPAEDHFQMQVGNNVTRNLNTTQVSAKNREAYNFYSRYPPIKVKTKKEHSNTILGFPPVGNVTRHRMTKRQVNNDSRVDIINTISGAATCTEDTQNCALTCTGGSLGYIDQDLDYLQDICSNRELTLTLKNCEFVEGTMKSSFFFGNYRLKALAIISCNLVTIQTGAFTMATVQNIKSLELINNSITTLTPGTFSGLKVLVNFRFLQQPLVGNTFKGTEFLKPMAATLQNATIMQRTELNVPVNPKEWFEGTDLKTLYTVDLSNNNLRGILDVRTFRNLVAVRRMYLQNCSLDFIDMTPFAVVQNLYYLYLNNNRLTTLDTIFLDDIHAKGIILSAKGNEWNCECENKEMVEYLQRIRYFSSLKAEDYVCFKPSEWSQLNMLNITVDCGTTIGVTTSVVPDDDETTNDISIPPDPTGNDDTTEEITTPQVVTEHEKTTDDITTPQVVTEHDKTTEDITTPPVVTGNDETTEDNTTPPLVTGNDETTEDITTPLVVTEDKQTTNDISTTTTVAGEDNTAGDISTTSVITEDGDTTTSLVTEDDTTSITDVEYIQCFTDNTSESFALPVKSSLVHFIINASSTTSVTITYDSFDSGDLFIIYFSNHTKYENASQTSENEWRISSLKSDETYLFCIVNVSDPTVSPFDCEAYSSATVVDVWLKIEDMPWFISVGILIALHCWIISMAVVYFILRKRSTNILVDQLSEKSPILPRAASSSTLRPQNRITYLSPKPRRNVAPKNLTLLYASPPTERAPTIPNVYYDHVSNECASSSSGGHGNTAKTQDHDAIVNYEETVSNLSNIYTDVLYHYPYISKGLTNEMSVNEGHYQVIDHYEEIHI